MLKMNFKLICISAILLFSMNIGNAQGAWSKVWDNTDFIYSSTNPFWNINRQNWIGDWQLSPSDHKLVGDFDGDGDEELYLVNNSNWSGILDYDSTILVPWKTMWHNGGNGWIGGWKMSNGDKHLVGDFNGDGKSDVLSINDNKYWSSVATYNKSTSSWVGLWHNNGNHWISGWYINNGDDYKIADFDNDGKDELLCISSTGWATLLDFENNNFTVKWHNSGSGWLINGTIAVNSSKKYMTGKFSSNSLSCLFTKDIIFSAGQYIGVAGIGNIGPVPLLLTFGFDNVSNNWKWYINSVDLFASNIGLDGQVLSANFDTDSKDEIFTVDASWARSSEWSSYSTSLNWHNAGNNKIMDFDLSGNNYYLAIKVSKYQPKHLLALKTVGNSLVKASLYRSNGNQNKSVQANTNNQNVQNNEIQLYPNPSNGVFKVLLKGDIDNDSEKTLQIIDINGREVYNQSFNATNFDVDLSDKSQGTYFLNVKTKENNYRTKFIIK